MNLLRIVLLPTTFVLGLLFAPPAHADRLVIPALRVNAPIVEVGTVNGAQESPASLWKAYHWRDGVQPCEKGSTVLTGHNYEVPGGKALFRHLDRLKPGSMVKIVRPGKDCTYLTKKSFKISVSANVAFMYDFDGPARGYLSTCVGRVGPGRYTHRLVTPMVLTTVK